MRRIVFVLMVCLTCSSCNNSEEYSFKGEVPDSRLVIYSYVEADSLIRAEILKSRTYTDNTEMDSTQDIMSQIYVNDNYAGELHSIGNNCYLSDVRPKAGDKITIKALCSGMEVATGTTIVCSPFPDIQLDTVRNGSTLQLQIRVKDNGEIVNYYRLVVEDEIYSYDCQWKDGHPELGSSVKYTYDVDLSGDELLSGDVISTVFGKEINANPYQLFTNKTFSDKEYILHANVDYPYSYQRESWYIVEGDTIRYVAKEIHQLRVKILRIDNSLFDYLTTLGIYEKQPDMYKEPVSVYSNVRGGFGVVGSCFMREIVVDFPVDEIK